MGNFTPAIGEVGREAIIVGVVVQCDVGYGKGEPWNFKAHRKGRGPCKIYSFLDDGEAERIPEFLSAMDVERGTSLAIFRIADYFPILLLVRTGTVQSRSGMMSRSVFRVS
jgi:hypothetical protein